MKLQSIIMIGANAILFAWCHVISMQESGLIWEFMTLEEHWYDFDWEWKWEANSDANACDT